jgi:hypothetical protein
MPVSLPVLRNPFASKVRVEPVMEQHCETGAFVPLGTCPCWRGVAPERRDVIQSWMRSYAAEQVR